jgi:hypothetical protein
MAKQQIGPFITAQVCILCMFGVLCWFTDLDASTRAAMLLCMQVAGMFGACAALGHRGYDRAMPARGDGNAAQAIEDPCTRAMTESSRKR